MSDDRKDQRQDRQPSEPEDPVFKDAVRATDPPPEKKEPQPQDFPDLNGEID